MTTFIRNMYAAKQRSGGTAVLHWNIDM